MRTEPSSERVLEGSDSSFDMIPPTQTRGQPISGDTDAKWMAMATACFETGTDFFDSAVRTKIEDAMSLYRSQHPSGSKYHSPSFDKRSKLFRPKTRSMMRKMESAVAMAFFSTSDAITCTAPNPGNKEQAQAARIQEALLNYRLNNTMPWFATVLGGFQDAARQGYVIARTSWEWREGKRYFESKDPATGATKRDEEKFLIHDRPRCDLIPAENIIIDPGCDWTDPLNTSPYLIELMPMYVHEIKERMLDMRLSSGMRYRLLPDSALISGRKATWDSVRSKREGNRVDRYDQKSGLTDFDIVWVHRNIIRVEGEDYIFDSIGTETMLSEEPVPLIEIDPRGYRPYVMGVAVIESHNPFPDGLVQMAKPLQEEINETANLRMDNVKMATIGRHYVRRGAAIDMNALARMVPGGVVEMTNVEKDLRWDKAPDVTQSAYEEQNLLQLELDDLIGNFSGASVGANRNMNETVGGMEMLGEGANNQTELTVRSYSETFMEPCLRQINDLIRIWETDITIAAIVGDKLKATPRDVFGALELETRTIVNVAFGATNPMKRIERLSVGLGTIAQFVPSMAQSADPAEVVQEVFGALGYRDAARFYPMLAGDEDPKTAALRQENEQLKGMLESKQMEIDGRIKVAEINANIKLQVEQLKTAQGEKKVQAEMQLKMDVMAMERELAIMDLGIEREKNQIAKAELYMQREALSHTIQMAEREFALQLQTTSMAPPPNPQDQPIPPNAQSLIQSLRRPQSQSPTLALEHQTKGEGDDKVGVISRGKYGAIPGKEG